MTTRPVAVSVSQATRLEGSSVRQASRMASETWSAILSGCPSVTDSEVNKWRFFDKRVLLSKRFGRYVWRGTIKRPHEMRFSAVLKRLPENARWRNLFGLSCGFWQRAEFRLGRRVADTGSMGIAADYTGFTGLLWFVYGFPAGLRGCYGN